MILAVASDLLFSSRIREAASKAATELKLVRNEDELSSFKESNQEAPKIVLVDLETKKIDPFSFIEKSRSLFPETTLIGFYSHVHDQHAELARAKGADHVMPRSKFFKELEHLVQS